MVKEGVAETLKRISEIKKRPDKVAELRRSHNLAIETIADLCFNDNITFKLPEGDPPYKPNPKNSDMQGMLFANLRRFAIFIGANGYENLTQQIREKQFIEFLESIDCDDAVLVCAIKDKKMPHRNLTKQLFQDAYPSLASTWKKKNG